MSCKARRAIDGVSCTSLCMRYDVWACSSCEPRAAGNGWTTVAVLSGPGPAGAAFACRFTPSSGVWEGGSVEWFLRVAAGCCDVPVSVAGDLRPAAGDRRVTSCGRIFSLTRSGWWFRRALQSIWDGRGVDWMEPDGRGGIPGIGENVTPGGRSATIFAAIAQCARLSRRMRPTWQTRSTRAKRMRVRRAAPCSPAGRDRRGYRRGRVTPRWCMYLPTRSA